MFSSPWHYFTDPVLQAPTIGSILMCLASALIGVIVFLRRRSLLGEALSHASYPGVVISIFIMATFFPNARDAGSLVVMIGAFCTAILGLWIIHKMERRLKVNNDAALCFVLSIFFGVGVLIASRLQFTHALWYKTVNVFLYGQAATMTDIHIYLYAGLAFLILSSVFFLYHPLKITVFDPDYAKSVGVPFKLLETLLFVLLNLAIIIGIRSVGVVLMAGMLIAPAIAARQFSHRLKGVFALAALFGAFSGFLGNYLSVELPQWGKNQGLEWKFTLPTGPMILLSAASICALSLLLAPKSGIVQRLLRRARFQRQCQAENLLKHLWKKGDRSFIAIKDLKEEVSHSSCRLFWMLFKLKREGWIDQKGKQIALTLDGWKRASHIVRLHRLWELYLVHLGQGVEKVHRSAEEMEHILTPDLEKELTELLDNPSEDPHRQPIPARDRPL